MISKKSHGYIYFLGKKTYLMSFLNRITSITKHVKTTKRLKKILKLIPQEDQRNEDENMCRTLCCFFTHENKVKFFDMKPLT